MFQQSHLCLDLNNSEIKKEPRTAEPDRQHKTQTQNRSLFISIKKLHSILAEIRVIHSI